MIMPRYKHIFSMPVTGSFESDKEDFDKALEILHHDKSVKETVELMLSHADLFFSFDNIYPTEADVNPEVIND